MRGAGLVRLIDSDYSIPEDSDLRFCELQLVEEEHRGRHSDPFPAIYMSAIADSINTV